MRDFRVIVYEGTQRARDFMEVFGRREVCVKSPITEYAHLPGFDEPQAVYWLDLDELTEEEEEKLAQFISRKFGVPIEDVILGLAQGVAIPAADCMLVIHNPQRWLD